MFIKELMLNMKISLENVDLNFGIYNILLLKIFRTHKLPKEWFQRSCCGNWRIEKVKRLQVIN